MSSQSSDKVLGLVKITPQAPVVKAQEAKRNTVALWEERWPKIAKQECVDKVTNADDVAETIRLLPCSACELNTACLTAKRKELGSLMYGRELLTRAAASESTLFPASLIEPLMNSGLSCVPFWHKPFTREHEYGIVQAWDIAWSEKVGGDWLVCMTAYVHIPSGRSVLLDVERWQQLSFDSQCALIERKANAFGADVVVIETDAAQAVWAQRVAESTPVPVVRHAAGDGKASLSLGVPSLLIKFENRKWEFPAAPGYHRDIMDVFVAELGAFSWVDGKLQGVGEHDDTVMAFWHLNYGIDLLLGGNSGVGEYHRGMQDGRSM